MKYVKILGLAAVAAMAFMAFVGATSASATVLCKVNTLTEGCAAGGQAYPSGTEIVATSSKALLTSGTEPVECESKVAGLASAGGSASTVFSVNSKGEAAELTTLEFTKCNHTTDVKVNGSLEVHWNAKTDNGTITSKGASVTVVIFGISCTYGTPAGGKSIGDITGGVSPGIIIHINVNVEKKEGSFLCPSEPTWEGEYTVTKPSPLYISGS